MERNNEICWRKEIWSTEDQVILEHGRKEFYLWDFSFNITEEFFVQKEKVWEENKQHLDAPACIQTNGWKYRKARGDETSLHASMQISSRPSTDSGD
jgi:hypothetical protein